MDCLQAMRARRTHAIRKAGNLRSKVDRQTAFHSHPPRENALVYGTSEKAQKEIADDSRKFKETVARQRRLAGLTT